VSLISYALRSKDLGKKLNKFLEEDTDSAEESKGEKPSAQEILDETEKGKNNKKPKRKK
jgi:hypothetical protein